MASSPQSPRGRRTVVSGTYRDKQAVAATMLPVLADAATTTGDALASLVLEHLSSAVVVLDMPAARVVSANRLARNLGYRLLGTIGDAASDAPEDILLAWLAERQVVERARKAARGGGAEVDSSFDEHRLSIGADPVTISYDVLPLGLLSAEENGSCLVVVVLRDVTDQRRTLAATEAATFSAQVYAEKLEAAIEHLADGVLVYDASGAVQSYNRAALYFARNHEDVEQARVRGIRVEPAWDMYGDDGVAISETELPVWRALLTGTPVLAEQHILRHDGEDVPVAVSVVPLRDESGAVTGAVAAFHDMRAVREIERIKDEFISIASHELRQPLTVIQGQAQMLRRRLTRMPNGTPLDSPEGRALLENLAGVQSQTARLNGLVSDLLDISRIQIGELQLEPEQVDLLALVTHVVSQQRMVSQTHTLRIETHLPAHVVELVGEWDPRRVEQVLMNILSNAIKYSPAGGEVLIEVDVLPDGISRGADDTTKRREVTGPAARIRVRDHGIGIPDSALPRLFERFFRASNTGGIQGTGLGLYICRQLVWAHSGDMWAESHGAGNGTSFLAVLPLVELRTDDH